MRIAILTGSYIIARSIGWEPFDAETSRIMVVATIVFALADTYELFRSYTLETKTKETK